MAPRSTLTARLRAVALVAAAVALAGGLAACGGGKPAATTESRTRTSAAPAAGGSASVPARPVALHVVATRRLPAPVQLPGTAVAGGHVLAAAGLDRADASIADVVAVAGAGVPRPRRIASLPGAIHDVGATGLGGRLLVFGGGSASGATSAITATDAAGRTQRIGSLPVAASDVEAATIGSTAYVVGGYTDTVPLRSVLAFTPGRPMRVVARLPHPLRYAAVAAVDGALLIAGGTDDVHARREVIRVDPATGRVRVIAKLPQPVEHAAGAALGGTFYVLGGRGDATGSQRTTIYAVDPVSGRVRRAGALPLALSDAGAATLGDRIWLVGGRDASGRVHDEAWALSPDPPAARSLSPGPTAALRPGRIPPLPDPGNVYAAERPGAVASSARHDPALVYVPLSQDDRVDVISQRTGRIVRSFPVAAEPQHVTPSWDLRTLFVSSDRGNSLRTIDPATGQAGRRLPVLDPYNLYFTADGRRAIVVAEAHRQLDFRDPHTMRLRHTLPTPECPGIDHTDYTADGRTALFSCEFGGRMIVVDLVHERVVRTIPLRAGGMPQDVKLSPDGRTFYVADMMANGVWLIDARSWRVIRLQPTGAGAHGLYPSRDARTLYVTNRGEGSISLISFRTRRPYRTWRLPGGGSPDMGGLSADGRTLWLSGRYDAEVYAIDTRSGRLVHRIRVGRGPHGLCVWPQPGRYSIGHTGILR